MRIYKGYKIYDLGFGFWYAESGDGQDFTANSESEIIEDIDRGVNVHGHDDFYSYA